MRWEHVKEKVVRYTQEINKKINKFYSDSLSDKPMMDLAKEKYLVNGNKLKVIE